MGVLLSIRIFYESNYISTAPFNFFNAHFVGNNDEASGYYLFADRFSISNPSFYCSNNSFAKSFNGRLPII